MTDTVSVLEDGVLVLDPATLLANDRDVDGDPIRFLSVQDGVNGTVTFDGTDIVFTPTPDFSGRAGFTYTVTDDRHGESTGEVEVTVISTNRAPEAVTDLFDTVEDVPFEFTIADLLANDTDLDGDTVRFVSIQSSIADARIIELPDGRYQFVPDENINGTRSFSYTVTDGRLTDRGTITFDIAAVNDAPIANPDGLFLGDQDTEFAIDFADLLFNDRDVEGDSFRIVDVFDGDNGTVRREGDTAVFLGREGYFGDGGFHYRVTDEFGATSTGYVSVLVLPLFDVPVAVSDAGFEMLEDSFLDIDPAELMANDQIPLGSEVIFLGLTGPGVTLLDNGLYRFTAAPDFFGQVTLRYALTNETGFEVPTTVTIDVLPVSDAPVAVDDLLVLTEDSALTIFVTQLTDNDYDVDRQAIQLTRILGSQGVTAELTGDGRLVVTPTAEFSGTGWFDYELRDSTGIADTARVTVEVGAVNDAPVIADPGLLEGVEDTDVSITLPQGTVTDADGDALLVELRSPGGAALPEWLSFDAETLTLTGTPPEHFNGDVALELSAFDGRAETVAPLTLRIAPVNDAPTAADGAAATDEDVSVALPVADLIGDVDGDPLEVSFQLDAALGTVVAQGDGWVFTPAANLNGPVTLGYTVRDPSGAEASGTIEVTVAPVNDAPDVTALFRTVTEEDAPFALDLLEGATDVENDALSVGAVSLEVSDGRAPGAVVTVSNGIATIRPDGFDDLGAGESATVTIGYIVSDGAAASVNTATITVTGVNDLPRFTSPDSFALDENTLEVGTVAATDPEGDAITYALVAGGADNGLFRIDTDTGALFFTTAPDWEAPGAAAGGNVYEVLVGASDGSGTATQLLQVTVQDVADSGRVLTGTPVRDALEGGPGDDVIETGGGVFDFATGGAGADVFIFTNGAGDGRQHATITDYTPGVDAIDLQGTVIDRSGSANGSTWLMMNGSDYDMLVVVGATSLDEITFV